MQQIVQSLRNGTRGVASVPEPIARPGTLLVANAYSLISAGTESMVTELAGKSLLGKARERPDQVRRVLAKIQEEGLLDTLRQVQTKLDQPATVGYPSAGIVLACGAGVQEFRPGDRVSSNGPHAEVVCVPKHLCARVPDGVPLDRAAFTMLGSIALHGVRLSRLQLGETALVVGLGLVGQLAVAMLKAQGCRVLAVDPDAARCDLALRMGADLARPSITGADTQALTGGLGVDAVLIAAAASSRAPMDLAADAVRKRGRIVLVGVVDLELDRRPFYFKECEFVVSCSYGPGRYDPDYEERGRDYPAPYVRWTEQRNMEAVLAMMAAGRVDVSPLITHRFPIDRAMEAYGLIDRGTEPYLGVLIEYPVRHETSAARVALPGTREDAGGTIGVGVIGAGNFAQMVLLPAIARNRRLRPEVICSATGVSAMQAGRSSGFRAAVADEDAVFGDPGVRAVFSVTRHDRHAAHVLKAQQAGKALFVEKPLCLSVDELEAIERALLAAAAPPLVMVGFNRRFSPAARAVKAFVEQRPGPLTVSIRFNALAVPPDHWTHDAEQGGGRIIGEACHAFDLATFLTGSLPVRVYAEAASGGPGAAERDDQCFVTLRHANGSVSNIAYLAGGDRAFPKERVEAIGGGAVAVIEDFRQAAGYAGGKRRVLWAGSRDKGHAAAIAAFADAVGGGSAWPIPWPELRATALGCILAVRSLREGVPFDIA